MRLRFFIFHFHDFFFSLFNITQYFIFPFICLHLHGISSFYFSSYFFFSSPSNREDVNPSQMPPYARHCLYTLPLIPLPVFINLLVFFPILALMFRLSHFQFIESVAGPVILFLCRFLSSVLLFLHTYIVHTFDLCQFRLIFTKLVTSSDVTEDTKYISTKNVSIGKGISSTNQNNRSF